MPSALPTIKQEALLGFHESYRQVDWKSLLRQASHSLHISVYYWDKWVHENERELCNFLFKPHSEIHFFFSSDSPGVRRLFPNKTTDQLFENIRNTYQPLQEFLKSNNLPDGKVTAHFLPYLLNYSMQCIDDRILVLSFFEMFRMEQIDSPAIILDLNKSPHLKKFYHKEIKGFLNAKP